MYSLCLCLSIITFSSSLSTLSIGLKSYENIQHNENKTQVYSTYGTCNEDSTICTLLLTITLFSTFYSAHLFTHQIATKGLCHPKYCSDMEGELSMS